MDRQINYPGQVPLETDLLQSNQNVMIGLAKLSQAIFGSATSAVGFGTTQTVVPSLNVLVAPGEVYDLQNLEATAVSSLPQDLAHSIVKQGILLDAATLAVPPPGTAGFSINYLVQVGYQDSDSGSTVLPYYNASNPSIAYSGPANSGAAQPTVRKGIAVATVKAGTAATTGTQTTPAPDAGKVGLYVVTVANGASTVVNANISPYPGAPLLPSAVARGRVIGAQIIGTTSTYTKTPGTKWVDVLVLGGGGGGGGTSATGAGQCSVGSGGAGGGWVRGIVDLTGVNTVACTVGAAGTSAANSGGTTGGTSAFGSYLAAVGGTGGSLTAATSSAVSYPTGGAGGGTASASGVISFLSGQGGSGSFGFVSVIPLGGQGGASFLGAGAPASSGVGSNSNSFGAGGSGGATSASAAAVSGGSGVQGRIFILELS